MADDRDHYKVLQVDSEAELGVIKAAYRRLAQKFHPDRAGDDVDARKKMIALNAAWEIMRDPAKRAAYDRERSAGASQPGPAGAARPPAHGGRPAGGPGRSGSDWQAGPDASTARPASEPVSGDWTSGRSSVGGGYDSSMRAPDGFGAAGTPPGNPSGSVLTFGRYANWSLGEIARVDLEFLEWLERSPIGRQYRDEVDDILRRAGRRRAPGDDGDRRGLFRR